MTDSYSNALAREGERLHLAIVAWGAQHNLRAYRVLTPTEQYFEIYNPATKTTSRDFPAKIRQALEANREALEAYAKFSRERDNRAALRRAEPSHPSPRPRFWEHTQNNTRTTQKVSERD